MMTAKEAWEATEKVNIFQHELRNIELLIEKAVENGYYSCSVYTINGNTLNEKTVSTLIGLGYIIEEDIKEDTHRYRIKWLKPEEEEEE